mgnify:CR=1 FL=1
MENEDLFSDLMKVYLAQMDSAMKISKIVSEHGKEAELSADSLISGLVYRLMVPMNDDEMKECMGMADEVMNGEYDTLNDSEPDDQDEGDRVIISRKVKTNTCNCDVCRRVRVCLSNYHMHETNDKLAQIFKDAIDNACNIHKINI